MHHHPRRPEPRRRIATDRTLVERPPGASRRVAASRLVAATAVVLLAAVLGACQVAVPPTVSDLRIIEGPVEGYPDGLVRAVAAVSGGFAYGSGTIVPGPTPRVEGLLVAVDDLEEGALEIPSGPACAELVLDPPDLRIHWQRDLFVYEDDVMVGYVARTDTIDLFPQAVGERQFGYVAASTVGSVTGTCDLGNEVVTWDLELLEGWNHLMYRLDEVDPVRRTSIRVEAPDPTMPWRFFLPN